MDHTLEHFKQDILEACTRIALYIEGHTFESFAKDVQATDAVMMKLIVIGEASKYFPQEIRDKNPDIRWTSVVGLRNFIAHEYFEIDPKVIWNTATIHIPELQKQIKLLSFE